MAALRVMFLPEALRPLPVAVLFHMISLYVAALLLTLLLSVALLGVLDSLAETRLLVALIILLVVMLLLVMVLLVLEDMRFSLVFLFEAEQILEERTRA